MWDWRVGFSGMGRIEGGRLHGLGSTDMKGPLAACIVAAQALPASVPVSLLITQRFEAVKRVPEIGSPLLVVHGGEDRLIQPELGRKLFDAATGRKAFVLVEGGSHHNTNSVGQAQYRVALASLFGLRTDAQVVKN